MWGKPVYNCTGEDVLGCLQLHKGRARTCAMPQLLTLVTKDVQKVRLLHW